MCNRWKIDNMSLVTRNMANLAEIYEKLLINIMGNFQFRNLCKNRIYVQIWNVLK